MPLNFTPITPMGRKTETGAGKKLLATSAATVALILSAGAPMSAQAQVVIDITDCADLLAQAENPGGATVNINTMAECTADGDLIDLEDNSNDGTIINVASGTTLTSTDADDEDVVVFVDNSEDNVTINIAAGAALNGEDGVIFFEGDAATLNNDGIITGTGEANEGVIYFDRDADGEINTIINTGTITGVGGPTIGVDSLLGTDPDTSVEGDEGGTAFFVLNNSGTISNSDAADDGDSDAINFNGDPGTTNSVNRGCLEGTVVLCQVNVDITNSGTISTARDNGGNAAIRVEQDAVLTGTIVNTADGVITGANTGINVNGAHADHNLTITNAGTITGTSNRGLVITGAGVTLNNQAGGTITGADAGLFVSGTTISVDPGGADPNADVDVAAIGNTFVNAGTISGGRASVDLSGAGEAVTFEQQGGALTGDFLGSTGFTDLLNFTTADFTLTNDILQDVNVSVANGVSLDFDGARTIDGNLVSDGDLSFDLGDAAQTVTGDVTLNTGSTVTIDDVSGVAALDQQFTLIDVGGTLVNNATLVSNITDTSFLLDFVAVADANGDLAVIATAAGGGGTVTTPPVTTTPPADGALGCADLPLSNPGGAIVNVDAMAECTFDGDIINLEDDTNDGTVINIFSATTLTSTDVDDEDVVIFVDNGEDEVTINIAEGAALNGEDGVIFFEGDAATLNNDGIITGTGEANEGVIYFDRDADSEVNTIINTGTITGVGGPTIGVDSLLGTDPDSSVEGDESGTAFFVLNNSGTISNSDTADDGDSDAINFNGDPGTTNSVNRGCLEGTVVLCQVNVDITNSGVIETARDNSSNAAIRVEQDAVLTGTIVNTADGVISGANTGILINGAHADHDLTITNAGIVEGVSNNGLVITGAGVTLNNQAGGTITGADAGLFVSGTTISVDPGGADPNADVDVAAIGNTFVNAGTISGGRASVDLSGAGEAVTFEQQGGALTGDFLGSTGFTDALNFTTADFTLTNDILQDVNVSVANGVSLDFDGARTIDGNLVSDGDLNFDLGDAAQTVTGDVTLNAGSTVTIEDVTGVAAIDEQFTLIDVGGTLVNDSTLVSNVTDTSFLLDFVAVADANGDLAVLVTAATDDMVDDMPDDMVDDMPDDMVDDMPDDVVVDPVVDPGPPQIGLSFVDANLSTFGSGVLSAFNSGGLNNTDAFSSLAAFGTQAEVEAEVENLAPDTTNATQQETIRAISNLGSLITQRISSLNKRASIQAPIQLASTSLSAAAFDGEYEVAQSGAWIQGGLRDARQGDGESSGGSTFAGYDASSQTIAIGYDFALNNSSIVGISGGFSSIDIDSDRAANDDTEIQVGQVTVYGAHRIGAIELSAQGGYVFGDVETEREAFQTIEGETDLDGFNVQAAASYNVDLSQSTYLAPFAAIQYGEVTTDSFTEEGGLNLEIDELDSEYIEGRIGVTVGKQFRRNSSLTDYYLKAAVVNDFGSGTDDINAAFADQAVALEALDTEDLRFNGQVGYNWISEGAMSIGLVFEGDFSDSYSSVGGNARVKFNF